MKLSELVFECVKDSISLPNSNIGYASFLSGEITDKKDYQLQISNVFSALNLGFSRLYTYDKIPYFVVPQKISNCSFDFPKNKGEIVNIAQYCNYGFEKLNFKILNIDKNQHVVVFNTSNNTVFVEYKKMIPQFNNDDLVPLVNSGTEIIDNNIDLLEEYNISNEMCNYLKEFVKGYIMEIYAPDLAARHNSLAEQYFNGIEETYTAFIQTRIKL